MHARTLKVEPRVGCERHGKTHTERRVAINAKHRNGKMDRTFDCYSLPNSKTTTILPLQPAQHVKQDVFERDSEVIRLCIMENSVANDHCATITAHCPKYDFQKYTIGRPRRCDQRKDLEWYQPPRPSLQKYHSRPPATAPKKLGLIQRRSAALMALERAVLLWR